MRVFLFMILLLAATGLHAQPKLYHRKTDDTAGRRLVAFAPICGIVAYGEVNPGLGFSFEYMLRPGSGIGLQLPLVFGYQGPEQVSYNGSLRHTAYYAAPGIRFHAPFRSGAAEFITGPSVILGNMHFSYVDDYYNNPGVSREPYNYSLVGLAADNSLNLYRRHFLFGFDVRVGTLIERHSDSRFFIHFGMHFGGRF